jgi:hypothetical protein
MRCLVSWTVWLHGPALKDGERKVVERIGESIIEDCESTAAACAAAIEVLDDALAAEFAEKAACGEQWTLGSIVMSASSSDGANSNLNLEAKRA